MTTSPVDPNRVLLTGGKPLHSFERDGRRSKYHRRQFLANPVLPRVDPATCSSSRAS